MPGLMWSPDAQGGFLANDQLSRKVRVQSQTMQVFRQFVRKEPGFGKGKGDTIMFDRVSNVSTGGGPIAELEKMPEDDLVISQGELTVTEYGNSVPWTGKLETLNTLSVDSIVTVALKNDMAKTLDRAVGTEFRTAPIIVVPTGSSGSPAQVYETSLATTATRNVQAWDVRRVIDKMKSTYLIPKFEGKYYVCICSTGFASAIKEDTNGAGWLEVSKYADPDRALNGELGTFYGCKFIEENNVLSNTLGGTAYNGEAIFFGEDPIVEGVAVPEELRRKIPGDYGRDKGLAWYSLHGYSLTYDSAVAGEAKVIRMWSV